MRAKFCSSIPAWSQRGRHSAANVAELLLAFKAAHSPRNQAVASDAH